MKPGGVPLWKDVLLTLSGLTGIGHQALKRDADVSLLLTYLGLLGIGAPGLLEWHKGRKGGE